MRLYVIKYFHLSDTWENVLLALLISLREDMVK